MRRYIVGTTNEIPPGSVKIVEVEKRSIGVFNIKGEYYALRNVCPHQLAPLCLGEVTGKVVSTGPGEYSYERDGEIIRCPWHGWEFDIKTGRSFFNPHRVKVRTYDVTVERGSRDSGTSCFVSGAEYDPDHDEDPSVETYKVTVEEEMVVVHV